MLKFARAPSVYTGGKLIDTAGKVDQFQKRYANWNKKPENKDAKSN